MFEDQTEPRVAKKEAAEELEAIAEVPDRAIESSGAEGSPDQPKTHPVTIVKPFWTRQEALVPVHHARWMEKAPRWPQKTQTRHASPCRPDAQKSYVAYEHPYQPLRGV